MTWDAVQTPVLFDGVFAGQKRKLLAQASAPAGRYDLVVDAANFNSVRQDVQVIGGSSGMALNFALQIGQIKSSVTVSAGNEYAAVESSSGTKTNLPLNEVPQAISVVNRQVMDAQNVVKMADALKNAARVMTGD